MELARFKKSWAGAVRDNATKNLVIAGLMVTNLLTAIGWFQVEQTVVLVPAVFDERMEVKGSEASPAYKKAWALTVDWIYGSLTAADKAKIRTVFLRWAEEMTKSNVVGDNLDHPVPIGVVNDPKLLSERRRIRWAANNYFTGHTRNLGLMAMSFDPADDPGNKLGNYMNQVTGAWLYMSDHLMKTDEAGGLGAEGFEYSPQAVGYIAQLLAAVGTAGRSKVKGYGSQATFENPFWEQVVPAYIHSLAPAGQISTDSNYQYLGPLHSVAWYGDGEKFYAGDPMGMMGAFGVYADLVHDDKKLNMLRWVETNLPPGGTMELSARGKDSATYINSIFYFLMFDPKAPSPQDPRPALPLQHFAPGLGRILARTSWTRDATWFTYKLGWSQIDHQHGDGMMFELYRKGEWLTKERTGYGFEVACSDYKNSLGLQNDVPDHNDNGYRGVEYKRGSQWLYVAEGDGKILAHSLNAKYVYALGDATPLYNSREEHSMDIVHASRSILWLSPDRIVVYDRAESKTDKRYKRFWMNLPKVATVKDGLATMPSSGQKLFVRALLPSPQSMSVEPAEPLDMNGNKQPAVLDPITYRIKTEAKGGPRSTRFLHVIQAADKDGAADTVTLVKSTNGTAYEGASMNDIVVMFPVDIGKASSISYTSNAKTHVITGLTPSAGYKVQNQSGKITITPGGDQKADSGGVLVIGQLP